MKAQLKLFLFIITVSVFSCADDNQSENQETATINKIFAFKIDEGCNYEYDSKLVTLNLENGEETEFISPLPMLSGLTLNPFSNKLLGLVTSHNTGRHSDIYQINPINGNIQITNLESGIYYSNLMIKNSNTVLLQKSNQIVEVNLSTGNEIVLSDLNINNPFTESQASVFLNSSNEIIGFENYDTIFYASIFKINLSTNSYTTIIDDASHYKNLIKDNNENVYVTKREGSNTGIMKLDLNTGSETLIGEIDIPYGSFVDGFYINNN